MNLPWLSWLLLVLAYAAYGNFLHTVKADPLDWGFNLAMAILVAGLAAFFWSLCRQVIVLGFRSDWGYFLLALLVAFLAITVVSQFRLFAYWLMLLAVALLARVDMMVARFKDIVIFFCLVLLSVAGLAISWLPHLLTATSHVPVE
ncbi:MAG: hypothetical protein KGQ93_07880 [Cyanobacteria bacterium REEB459]|nr:hypothetical protein [Cyanobacteria bacterium REEB459]